jgi:hypothetical protein
MVWKHLRSCVRDVASLGGCVAEENNSGSPLCRHLHCGDEKLIWRLGYLHDDRVAAPTGVVIWCEEDGVKFIATESKSVVGV